MKRYISGLAAAIAISVLLASSASAQQIPLKASDWLIDPLMPSAARPSQDGDVISFTFDSKVGYLVLPWRQAITGDAITVTFSIETERAQPGKPVRFVAPASPDGCFNPPAAHVYFQSFGLYNDVDGTRWWSNPIAYELREGLVTLVVPLEPKQWSSTFGHSAEAMEAAFRYALNHPSYIGLTFGGSCSFGHGAFTRKGSAWFTLLDYSVR